MDGVDQEVGGIKRLLSKLRYITLAIQIMPFVYSMLYIIAMFLYLFVPEETRCVLDTLLYVSPVAIIGLLVTSHILELCRWHKAACIIPVLPQVLVFVDQHMVELTIVEAYISIIAPVVLSILLIVSAYKVFMK